ncbi:MAG TPA: hypothetical protein VLX58_01625 [Bryobacteraceae bacterium]|nr:hypothetical protein [Bryobacteraceae bacterium]
MSEVTELLDRTIALWQQCPASLPEFEHAFSPDEQTARERQLELFFEGIERELRSLPRTRSERQAARERINAAFARFATDGLDLKDRHLDLLLRGGFSSIGTKLARRARQFDPGVSTADILQASRNAWTACALQVLLGRTMQLTPSIFAYSMLYPYTDNYLDDPSIPGEAKQGFSARFGQRLSGDAVAPANRREATIWQLISLIEEEYGRSARPQVFAGLNAIHRAQSNSMRLLRRGLGSRGIDVVRLSFDKGGTSVLADGYLAAGSLSPAEAQFVFDWGVLLQLADDLQDVRQDREDGMLTVFSEMAGREPLDGLTSRTLQFARVIMREMDGLPGPDCRALKEMIETSSRSLLIRAAGELTDLYTEGYLAELESHSPFRFSMVNERRKRLAARGHLFNRLFEAFLEGDEDEPAFPVLPSSLMPRV